MWEAPLNPDELKEYIPEETDEAKISIKQEPKNLYQVIKAMTDQGNFYSRICLVTKLKDIEMPSLDKLKDLLIDEINSFIEKPVNILLNILGGQYCIFSLESSGDKLLEFIKQFHKHMQREDCITESCNVISFIEDASYCTLPSEFVYITDASPGTMNEYKGKNLCEKKWIIYNNLCEFGKNLTKLNNINDESQKKPIIASFVKYIPGIDDLRDLLSSELTSLEDFVSMYCDYLDVELDEELVWPYHWHLNL